MIPAVPASLQCVVADSGKLQSPDTHGDAARVTRAKQLHVSTETETLHSPKLRIFLSGRYNSPRRR